MLRFHTYSEGSLASKTSFARRLLVAIKKDHRCFCHSMNCSLQFSFSSLQHCFGFLVQPQIHSTNSVSVLYLQRREVSEQNIYCKKVVGGHYERSSSFLRFIEFPGRTTNWSRNRRQMLEGMSEISPSRQTRGELSSPNAPHPANNTLAADRTSSEDALLEFKSC